jgi:hemolysin III
MTAAEERANCISHAIGLLAVLAAAPAILATAWSHGEPAVLAGVAVFALAAVLVYGCSSTMHGLPAGRVKNWLEVADHSVIFLMIAGTYTPLTLLVLPDWRGWALLAGVWGVAAYGITRTLAGGVRKPYKGGLLYVAMGWMVLLVAPVMFSRMSTQVVVLVAAGGLAYTGGFWFYRARWIMHHHLVWHLFVMLGTGLHYAAVWLCLA